MGAQNTNCTMKFIDIPEDRQREAINTVALQTGLPPSSIEKDWWVTQVLKALHTLPYAEHIAFKGGTSLSKCWNLIARFSEDVDIALSREFLGSHHLLLCQFPSCGFPERQETETVCFSKWTKTGNCDS